MKTIFPGHPIANVTIKVTSTGNSYECIENIKNHAWFSLPTKRNNSILGFLEDPSEDANNISLLHEENGHQDHHLCSIGNESSKGYIIVRMATGHIYIIRFKNSNYMHFFNKGK